MELHFSSFKYLKKFFKRQFFIRNNQFELVWANKKEYTEILDGI